MPHNLDLRQFIAGWALFAFLGNLFILPPSHAQGLVLPKPGVRVQLSPAFNPPTLKGLKVYTDNPFKFDFILDQGDSLPLVGRAREGVKEEAKRLIKYFLAAITVPENDLWVNLSPYEKDRIIPQAFGQTEMGRDLLAQDYLLKQVTASLIYPEEQIGKEFWQRVYAQAQAKFGTTNIPVNTFNKVWIVPEKAVVYENGSSMSFPNASVGNQDSRSPTKTFGDDSQKTAVAYVVESKLKVMLEEDYLALSHAVIARSPDEVGTTKQSFNKIASLRPSASARNDTGALAAQIVRDIVLPQLQKEINEGANFAPLRQVYNSLILAAWYKKKIKDSILAKVYADKNKVAGIGYELLPTRGHVPEAPPLGGDRNVSPSRLPSELGLNVKANQGETDRQRDTDINRIYTQYLAAFKKGVFNYIKEDSSVILSPVSPVILSPEGAKDPNVSNTILRKYFSGGVTMLATPAMVFTTDAAQLPKQMDGAMKVKVDLAPSQAMTADKTWEDLQADLLKDRTFIDFGAGRVGTLGLAARLLGAKKVISFENFHQGVLKESLALNLGGDPAGYGFDIQGDLTAVERIDHEGLYAWALNYGVYGLDQSVLGDGNGLLNHAMRLAPAPEAAFISGGAVPGIDATDSALRQRLEQTLARNLIPKREEIVVNGQSKDGLAPVYAVITRLASQAMTANPDVAMSSVAQNLLRTSLAELENSKDLLRTLVGIDRTIQSGDEDPARSAIGFFDLGFLALAGLIDAEALNRFSFVEKALKELTSKHDSKSQYFAALFLQILATSGLVLPQQVEDVLFDEMRSPGKNAKESDWKVVNCGRVLAQLMHTKKDIVDRLFPYVLRTVKQKNFGEVNGEAVLILMEFVKERVPIPEDVLQGLISIAKDLKVNNKSWLISSQIEMILRDIELFPDYPVNPLMRKEIRSVLAKEEHRNDVSDDSPPVPDLSQEGYFEQLMREGDLGKISFFARRIAELIVAYPQRSQVLLSRRSSALRSGNLEAIIGSLSVFKHLQKPSLISGEDLLFIVGLIKHEDARIRSLVYTVMGNAYVEDKVYRERLLPVFLKALRSDDRGSRVAAIHAFTEVLMKGEAADDRVVDAIRNALWDQDPEVVASALDCLELGILKHDQSFPGGLFHQLLGLLVSANNDVRSRASAVISLARKKGLMPLVPMQMLEAFQRSAGDLRKESQENGGDAKLQLRMAMLMAAKRSEHKIPPADVKYVASAIHRASDPGALRILLRIMLDWTRYDGSSEAQDYFEARMQELARRKLKTGQKYVQVDVRDELMVAFTAQSVRQIALFPLLTDRKFPFEFRVKVLRILAGSGYADSSYLEMTDEQMPQVLEMISQVQERLGFLAPKVLIDSLMSSQEALDELIQQKPEIDKIIAFHDHRELIRALVGDTRKALVYYLLNQSPFQYPGTSALSFERFEHLLKDTAEKLDKENKDVVLTQVTEGYVRAGLDPQRSLEVAQALLAGRPPLPKDSPYLDAAGNFIPQKVDVLQRHNSTEQARGARESFQTALNYLSRVLKIYYLFKQVKDNKKILKARDPKAHRLMLVHLMNISEDIHLGIDVNHIYAQLLALNDQIYPPQGRNRDVEHDIAAVINKQIKQVSFLTDFIDPEVLRSTNNGTVLLEKVDIDRIIRNQNALVNQLRAKKDRRDLSPLEEEIIGQEHVGIQHVLKIMLRRLLQQLDFPGPGASLYAIFEDVQGHLLGAMDNYTRLLSAEGNMSDIPPVVYLDYIEKFNLFEFFRFADGGHCCLSSDPKVADFFNGFELYHQQLPRFSSNATNFWWQVTTAPRGGKQVGWHENWIGLDLEHDGKVFVGTELLYLSPSFRNKGLQEALLKKEEEVLFSTHVSAIAQALPEHIPSNALTPPVSYGKTVMTRFKKLQSLDDRQGGKPVEPMYEDSPIAPNEEAAREMYVRWNDQPMTANPDAAMTYENSTDDLVQQYVAYLYNSPWGSIRQLAIDPEHGTVMPLSQVIKNDGVVLDLNFHRADAGRHFFYSLVPRQGDPGHLFQKALEIFEHRSRFEFELIRQLNDPTFWREGTGPSIRLEIISRLLRKSADLYSHKEQDALIDASREFLKLYQQAQALGFELTYPYPTLRKEHLRQLRFLFNEQAARLDHNGTVSLDKVKEDPVTMEIVKELNKKDVGVYSAVYLNSGNRPVFIPASEQVSLRGAVLLTVQTNGLTKWYAIHSKSLGENTIPFQIVQALKVLYRQTQVDAQIARLLGDREFMGYLDKTLPLTDQRNGVPLFMKLGDIFDAYPGLSDEEKSSFSEKAMHYCQLWLQQGDDPLVGGYPQGMYAHRVPQRSVNLTNGFDGPREVLNRTPVDQMKPEVKNIVDHLARSPVGTQEWLLFDKNNQLITSVPPDGPHREKAIQAAQKTVPLITHIGRYGRWYVVHSAYVNQAPQVVRLALIVLERRARFEEAIIGGYLSRARFFEYFVKFDFNARVEEKLGSLGLEESPEYRREYETIKRHKLVIPSQMEEKERIARRILIRHDLEERALTPLREDQFPGLSDEEFESYSDRLVDYAEQWMIAYRNNVELIYDLKSFNDGQMRVVSKIVDQTVHGVPGLALRAGERVKIEITRLEAQSLGLTHMLDTTMPSKISAHTAPNGNGLNIEVRVVHEFVHQITRMLRRNTKEMVFSRHDWKAWLQETGYTQVKYNGNEMTMDEYLSDQLPIEEIQRRISALYFMKEKGRPGYSKGNYYVNTKKHLFLIGEDNPKYDYYLNPIERLAHTISGSYKYAYLHTAIENSILTKDFLRDFTRPDAPQGVPRIFAANHRWEDMAMTANPDAAMQVEHPDARTQAQETINKMRRAADILLQGTTGREQIGRGLKIAETLLLAGIKRDHPVRRVVVVGQGSHELAALLAAGGVEVLFLDYDYNLFNEMKSHLEEAQQILARDGFASFAPVQMVQSKIGSLDLQKEKLQPHSYDAVTLVSLIGGILHDSADQVLQKVADLLPGEGGLLLADLSEGFEGNDFVGRLDKTFKVVEELAGSADLVGEYSGANKLLFVKPRHKSMTSQEKKDVDFAKGIWPDVRRQKDSYAFAQRIIQGLNGKIIRVDDGKGYVLKAENSDGSLGEEKIPHVFVSVGKWSLFDFEVRGKDLDRWWIFPEDPVRGKHLVGRALSLLSEVLPPGTMLRGVLGNEETWSDMRREFEVKEDALVRRRDGARVVDIVQDPSRELSWQEVIHGPRKMGYLFSKYLNAPFRTVVVFDRPKTGDIAVGAQALKLKLQDNKALFEIVAVKGPDHAMKTAGAPQNAQPTFFEQQPGQGEHPDAAMTEEGIPPKVMALIRTLIGQRISLNPQERAEVEAIIQEMKAWGNVRKPEISFLLKIIELLDAHLEDYEYLSGPLQIGQQGLKMLMLYDSDYIEDQLIKVIDAFLYFVDVRGTLGLSSLGRSEARYYDSNWGWALSQSVKGGMKALEFLSSELQRKGTQGIPIGEEVYEMNYEGENSPNHWSVAYQEILLEAIYLARTYSPQEDDRKRAILQEAVDKSPHVRALAAFMLNAGMPKPKGKRSFADYKILQLYRQDRLDSEHHSNAKAVAVDKTKLLKTDKIWDLAPNLVMVHFKPGAGFGRADMGSDTSLFDGLKDIWNRFGHTTELYSRLQSYTTPFQVTNLKESKEGEFQPDFQGDAVFAGGALTDCLAKAVADYSRSAFRSGKTEVTAYLLAPYIWTKAFVNNSLESLLKTTPAQDLTKVLNENFGDVVVRSEGKAAFVDPDFLASTTVKVRVGGIEQIVYQGGSEHTLIIDIVMRDDVRLTPDAAMNSRAYDPDVIKKDKRTPWDILSSNLAQQKSYRGKSKGIPAAIKRYFEGQKKFKWDINFFLSEFILAALTYPDDKGQHAIFNEFSYLQSFDYEIFMLDVWKFAQEAYKDSPRSADARMFLWKLGETAFQNHISVFGKDSTFRKLFPLQVILPKAVDAPILDLAAGTRSAQYIRNLRSPVVLVDKSYFIEAYLNQAKVHFNKNSLVTVRRADIRNIHRVLRTPLFSHVRLSHIDAYVGHLSEDFYKRLFEKVRAGGTVSVEYPAGIKKGRDSLERIKKMVARDKGWRILKQGSHESLVKGKKINYVLFVKAGHDAAMKADALLVTFEGDHSLMDGVGSLVDNGVMLAVLNAIKEAFPLEDQRPIVDSLRDFTIEAPNILFRGGEEVTVGIYVKRMREVIKFIQGIYEGRFNPGFKQRYLISHLGLQGLLRRVPAAAPFREDEIGVGAVAVPGGVADAEELLRRVQSLDEAQWRNAAWLLGERRNAKDFEGLKQIFISRVSKYEDIPPGIWEAMLYFGDPTVAFLAQQLKVFGHDEGLQNTIEMTLKRMFLTKEEWTRIWRDVVATSDDQYAKDRAAERLLALGENSSPAMSAEPERSFDEVVRMFRRNIVDGELDVAFGRLSKPFFLLDDSERENHMRGPISNLLRPRGGGMYEQIIGTDVLKEFDVQRGDVLLDENGTILPPGQYTEFIGTSYMLVHKISFNRFKQKIYILVQIHDPAQMSKSVEPDAALVADKLDNAAVGQRGGIDLTEGKMPLSVILKPEGLKPASPAGGDPNVDNKPLDPSQPSADQDDNGIKFNIDPAMLKQFEEASGLVPINIRIEPLGDLRLFLGVVQDPVGQIPTG